MDRRDEENCESCLSLIPRVPGRRRSDERLVPVKYAPASVPREKKTAASAAEPVGEGGKLLGRLRRPKQQRP